jgi:hypothetical protein
VKIQGEGWEKAERTRNDGHLKFQGKGGERLRVPRMMRTGISRGKVGSGRVPALSPGPQGGGTPAFAARPSPPAQMEMHLY